MGLPGRLLPLPHLSKPQGLLNSQPSLGREGAGTLASIRCSGFRTSQDHRHLGDWLCLSADTPASRPCRVSSLPEKPSLCLTSLLTWQLEMAGASHHGACSPGQLGKMQVVAMPQASLSQTSVFILRLVCGRQWAP